MKTKRHGGRVKGRALAKLTCLLGHGRFYDLFFRAVNGEIPIEIANLVRDVMRHHKETEQKREELGQIHDRLGSARISAAVRRWFRHRKKTFGYTPEEAIAKARLVKNPDNDVLNYYKAVVKWDHEEHRRASRLIGKLGVEVFNAIGSGDSKVLHQMAVMMNPAMEKGDQLRTLILLRLQLGRGSWDGPFSPDPDLTLAELKHFLERTLKRPVDRSQVRRIVEDEYGWQLARARGGGKRNGTVK